MNITAVDISFIDTPLPVPLANPLTSGASITTILAEVHTAQGITGQGTGWSIGMDRARMIAAATEGAARFALGRDATRIEALWSAWEGYSNFVGSSGLATMGMSILDIALWDIQGQALGQPLWRMLGGHKDKARMYCNLIDSDPSGTAPTAELMAGLEAAWARGYREFKLRMGLNAPLVDAGRVRDLVRAAAGQPARCAIDVAQRWSATDALAACVAMDDLGLFWIEDPGHQDDYAGIRNLARQIRTPICTGENAYGVRGGARVIDEIGCPWVMLDLMRCGGISGWRKVAALAEARHIRMATHAYPHIGVQLVAGTLNATFGEVLPWWDDLYGPIAIRDGHATPDDTPGVGARIAATDLRRAVSWAQLRR